MLRLFASGREPAGANETVVYAPGSFDLFHAGHLAFLEAASALGDRLVVGLHADEEVNTSSRSTPFMNLFERVMTVMSFRCVDDVILSAPREVTRGFMDSFRVGVVCRGAVSSGDDDDRCYEIPRAEGRFRVVESGCGITTEEVVRRVLERRAKRRRRRGRRLRR